MSHWELLRRREALLAAGGAGAALAFGLPRLLPADAAACVLQKEATEGPFYLDLDLFRRDITSGRPGTPLSLRFQVIDGRTCKPLQNAIVEIWHTDAGGVYSGVSGDSGNFMRGGQRTNAKGIARFKTIVPGWYPGRTPHIHVKVFAGGEEVHTGQVYFRESVLRTVYGKGVYAGRGAQDTTNDGDFLFQDAGRRAIVPLKRAEKGYTGLMVLGIDT